MGVGQVTDVGRDESRRELVGGEVLAVPSLKRIYSQGDISRYIVAFVGSFTLSFAARSSITIAPFSIRTSSTFAIPAGTLV